MILQQRLEPRSFLLQKRKRANGSESILCNGAKTLPWFSTHWVDDVSSVSQEVKNAERKQVQRKDYPGCKPLFWHMRLCTVQTDVRQLNSSAAPLWGPTCRLSGRVRGIKAQCPSKTKCRQFTSQLLHLEKELGWTYLRSNYKWRDFLFSIVEILFLTRKHSDTKAFVVVVVAFFCFVNKNLKTLPNWIFCYIYLLYISGIFAKPGKSRSPDSLGSR